MSFALLLLLLLLYFLPQAYIRKNKRLICVSEQIGKSILHQLQKYSAESKVEKEEEKKNVYFDLYFSFILYITMAWPQTIFHSGE